MTHFELVREESSWFHFKLPLLLRAGQGTIGERLICRRRDYNRRRKRRNEMTTMRWGRLRGILRLLRAEVFRALSGEVLCKDPSAAGSPSERINEPPTTN